MSVGLEVVTKLTVECEVLRHRLHSDGLCEELFVSLSLICQVGDHVAESFFLCKRGQQKVDWWSGFSLKPLHVEDDEESLLFCVCDSSNALKFLERAPATIIHGLGLCFFLADLNLLYAVK